MPKTKRRIDKKNAITFKLVNRSQRDPLIADENAPQHVLVEQLSEEEKRKRREEQIKYGVYFDDDYDYLQHLTEVNRVETEWEQTDTKAPDTRRKVMLPSSVFASNVEEDEGMLNKAVLPVGPQPDWDPEIVAAMDEDFDFEDPNNIIDDDFVLQANGDGDEVEGENENYVEDEEDDEGEDEDDSSDYSSTVSAAEGSFKEEETKSHFTNYSATSSVMRRNKGLQLIDERFETLFENEYAEETDIGALDFDEIGGSKNINENESINQLIKEVAMKLETENLVQEDETAKEYLQNFQSKFGDVDSSAFKVAVNLGDEDDDEEEEKCFVEIEESGKNRLEDRFDCESILSTYSNLYNRPKLICEERVPRKLKIDLKTGIPVVDKQGLTAKNLKKLDQDDNGSSVGFDARSIYSRTSRISEISIRPKDETPEERKSRKMQVKEYKKERRAEKKANKLAFKLEEQKQSKDLMNLRYQLKAVKLN